MRSTAALLGSASTATSAGLGLFLLGLGCAAGASAGRGLFFGLGGTAGAATSGRGFLSEAHHESGNIGSFHDWKGLKVNEIWICTHKYLLEVLLTLCHDFPKMLERPAQQLVQQRHQAQSAFRECVFHWLLQRCELFDYQTRRHFVESKLHQSNRC